MLLDQIQSDLKTALKKRKKVELSTLRFLLAAIRNKEIELQKRGKLGDDEILVVIQKQVKQHQESIEAYQKNGREDLAEKEREELSILSKYLPRAFSSEELEKIIDEAIRETVASGQVDFGKIMGTAMGRVKGRADGSEVARMVKEKLR